MEMESGEFLLKAVPLLIGFGILSVAAIVYHFMTKRYYDEPDYRDYS